MKSLLSRNATRRLDLRLRTYGVTAALGLFTMGGVLPQCAPAPAVVVVSNIQDSVVNTVNQQRELAGLGALSVDGRLTAAAQGHSDHMAREQIMTHRGAGQTNAGQRINGAGYRWTTWGENVAAGQATAADVMSAWLNSAGHRANILNAGFAQLGVAATNGANALTYWTMLLAAGG